MKNCAFYRKVFETQVLLIFQEFNAEPTSAPPLFTPPEVPDYLLSGGHVGEDGSTAEPPFTSNNTDQGKSYNTNFRFEICARILVGIFNLISK